jgi:hypothetical protein
MQQSLDRRERRTDDVELATQYQLVQILADFGVSSVVLVDSADEVIAEAGEATGCARLAENAFDLACGGRRTRRRPKNTTDYACSFRLNGESFIVAACGPQKEMREVGVFRAILGLRRIRG